MSDIQPDLRYTDEHEWISVLGKNEAGKTEVAVGITDYAQAALGDLVFVELPEVGSNLSTGDNMAVAESVKAASEVYAPISGEVYAINADLEDTPELINQSPYEEGWVAKIILSDENELNNTMSADQYATFLEGQD